MNKDQLKGRGKEIGGKMQRKVADMTDDEKGHVEGTDKEIRGKIQKNFGDAKNKVADAIDR